MASLTWLFIFYCSVAVMATFTFISQTHMLYKCLVGKEMLSIPLLINITLWCLESAIGTLSFNTHVFFNNEDLPGKYI
jgi:hypothetical protein